MPPLFPPLVPLSKGGGRNHVTSRYTRHFNMVSIVDFDNTTLTRIFSSILEWALTTNAFPANIKVSVMPCEAK